MAGTANVTFHISTIREAGLFQGANVNLTLLFFGVGQQGVWTEIFVLANKQ